MTIVEALLTDAHDDDNLTLGGTEGLHDRIRGLCQRDESSEHMVESLKALLECLRSSLSWRICVTI